MICAALTGAVVHEAGHALLAYIFGDRTAQQAGRLSLNPLKHIDLFTTILIPLLLIFIGFPPLILFKPIPVNFNQLNKPKLGMIAVSLAGPLSNILLAIIFIILIRVISIIKVNPVIMIINVFLFYGIIINIFLAMFNLIPFPPLDGSWILTAILPVKISEFFQKNRTTFMIVFLFLIFSGLFAKIISPLFNFIEKTVRILTGL